MPGKFYDYTLKDSTNLKDTITQLTIWFKEIDNSQLLGKFKVWCFQYGKIPRLEWPFLLYNFPLTQVEVMERLYSRFVRRWLGVPPTFSSVNLYSKTSKLRLPVSSVVAEFKATKARAVSTLLLSKDEKVWHANKTGKCGRKWKPQKAVREAESYWKHQEIIAVVCQGRLGLGNYKAKSWSKVDAKGRRRRPACKSSRARLSRTVDAGGSGTQLFTVLEGTLECWPGQINLPLACCSWPIANSKQPKDLRQRQGSILPSVWSSPVYPEPHLDRMSQGTGRRTLQMETWQGPCWNFQMDRLTEG